MPGEARFGRPTNVITDLTVIRRSWLPRVPLVTSTRICRSRLLTVRWIGTQPPLVLSISPSSRTDVEAFITREAVEACTSPGVFERPPDRKHSYVGFVDPSGGSSDAMTLAIAHTEGKTQILDVVRERKPPFSPEAVVEEYAALLRTTGAPRFMGIGTAVNGRGSNSRSATSTMNRPRTRSRRFIRTCYRSSTRARLIFLRTSALSCSSPS